MFTVVIPVLFPLLAGALLPVFGFRTRRRRNLYVELVTILNSLIVFALLLQPPAEPFMALNLAGSLAVTFHVDGLSTVFAGLIAALWPLATLYAFAYMKHEGKEDSFFAFYTMTFGVTVGIAFAGNLMTLYMFYELLTLITLPLVTAGMSHEAIRAGRKYIFYSIGGAAFAFIGFMFIFTYGATIDFVGGGVLPVSALASRNELLRLAYVFAVLGFGVKAAIFPFHGWLPTASIAPTPVTALLHAVAVVKAGAFAIIRITYYSYGTDLLRGTWAQYVVLGFAVATILYGSARALKEPHFKRRLAYSTISNLSYVVFGALLMTPLGLVGSLSHMVFHAVIKITLFFCAGAVLCGTGRQSVHELTGLGRKMPWTFACFTVAALALTGIPLFAGFISKWNLCTAAVNEGSAMAYLGVAALLVSAFLTAVYLLPIAVRAFFPPADFDAATLGQAHDPSWQMKLPLLLFCIAIIGFGVYSAPLMACFTKIVAGAL